MDTTNSANADTITPTRILTVEDNPDMRHLLDRLLTDAGYQVDTASTGRIALHAALSRTYHILIIDRGLPDMDGLDLLRRLRRDAVPTPTLILTAYATVADRVAGLDAGAEDYLVKPFATEELLARLRALRRRGTQLPGPLRIGDVVCDLTDRVATLADGTDIPLSGRETALLRALAAKPQRVHSRTELHVRVFPDAASDNIIDTYVHHLRRKLGSHIIKTVRGMGFRLGNR